MSFPYEGPQNALRSRIRPSTHQIERMPDLPMKAAPVVRKPRAAQSKATWEERKKAAEQKVSQVRQSAQQRKSPVKRTAKPLPTLQGEQPRDALGRFARKTGQVLWAGAKATGKAIKGTAKAVKRAHKTVKRVQSNARKRSALEHRERRLDLHQRERAAGLKRKKVVRKRVRR